MAKSEWRSASRESAATASRPDRSNAAAPDLRPRRGACALRSARALPRDPAAQALARRLMRAVAGVGADIEEAQRSHSRRASARRVNIARGAAREPHHGLRPRAQAEVLACRRREKIRDEADRLVRVPVTVVNKTRESP